MISDYRSYDILEPIFMLVSRFPSDYASDEQIQMFLQRVIKTMKQTYHRFSGAIRPIKYMPKIAAVWKGRVKARI